MKLLVFDVGGTEIKYAIVEDALTITEKGSLPTPADGFDRFLDLIDSVYRSYADSVEGIAMALPGPVDVQRGEVGNCGAMKYPHPKEVAALLEERCGCPVVLENDGKAAALAEHHYGSLQGCTNAAVFLIGTGVGGGLILNGEILRGIHHTAGEFSFLNTEASSYRDYGQILGNSCSTAYLLNQYRVRSGTGETADGIGFFRRLPEDPHAKEALNDLCANIAVQIYNLSILLDLEKVAIGGGISQQTIVIDTIKAKFEEVRRDSFTGKIRFPIHTEIVPCVFRNDANLIGAFLTYQESQKRPE